MLRLQIAFQYADFVYGLKTYFGIYTAEEEKKLSTEYIHSFQMYLLQVNVILQIWLKKYIAKHISTTYNLKNSFTVQVKIMSYFKI